MNAYEQRIAVKFVKALVMKIKASTRGLTLIEVMIVVLIIAVAVIGAMNFRYYGVTHSKKADVQANAARIGSMMLEIWDGLGGIVDPANPDTTALDIALAKYSPYYTIAPAGQGAVPPLFNHIKSYQIRDLSNGVYYFVSLSYKQAVTGTSPEPQALNATISWNRGYGTSGASEHTISISTYLD